MAVAVLQKETAETTNRRIYYRSGAEMTLSRPPNGLLFSWPILIILSNNSANHHRKAPQSALDSTCHHVRYSDYMQPVFNLTMAQS